MNQTKSIFSTERIFLRACLESVPQGAQLRSDQWSAGQRPAPTRLHVLKQRLLQAALKQTALPHVERQLCAAANVAAETAWNTAFPLLLYSCLFTEMATEILNRFILDEPIDDASLALPEENDPTFDDADTTNGWPHLISKVNVAPQMLA